MSLKAHHQFHDWGRLNDISVKSKLIQQVVTMVDTNMFTEGPTNHDMNKFCLAYEN